ncbi:MAG: hypothetical protein IT555_03325 [Acetobacteraceae bacterium]|nr:hypothetical protein [Acetobacteraceae bacterium]
MARAAPGNGTPAPAPFGAAGAPRILAVVDTEEEFDWSAPFDRARSGVEHMLRIGELQAVFERHGLRPTYAIGSPIATQDVAVAALRPLADSGRALIGAHLHPWLTPPLEEAVSAANSFPGNLPPALERAKIATLTGEIEAAFGRRPTIYKAGRYGNGPNSFAILESLGYEIDISPMPPFDFSHRHGPDYSRRGNGLTWEGPRRSVLSIPNTGAFVGPLARPLFARLGELVQDPRSLRWRLPGVLARLGLLERIGLTPEGYTLGEMCRLAEARVRAGQRLFVLFLHSPSVAPGHTPYVRNEADQAAFLQKIDHFLGWFRRTWRAEPTDPPAVRALCAADRAPAAAKPAMTVRPIQDADLPALARFWHANLNAGIPEPVWRGAFGRRWHEAPPNHGFMLLADGALVGAIGAIYARQTLGTEAREVCNLTSLVVDEAYRARAMDLISACLTQKQFCFTNFTPTPSVAKMLKLFRFRELPGGERVVLGRPLPARFAGLRALAGPAALKRVLDGAAAQIWRDHRDIPWLRSFAIGDGTRWCLVVWKPAPIKRLPGARIIGVSDPALFAAWHQAAANHLLLRNGAFALRIEQHMLPAGCDIGIARPVTMQRLFRGPAGEDAPVSFLYSELAALPI